MITITIFSVQALQPGFFWQRFPQRLSGGLGEPFGAAIVALRRRVESESAGRVKNWDYRCTLGLFGSFWVRFLIFHLFRGSLFQQGAIRCRVDDLLMLLLHLRIEA